MTTFEGIQPFANEWGCGTNGNTQGGGMDYNTINSSYFGDSPQTGDGIITYHVGLDRHHNLQTRIWN